MKKLRTFVIPAKAGIGAKKFYKYLIGARCARFRVPIPACAGMTIFVNKNCKKYFAKLLFSEVMICWEWGFIFDNASYVQTAVNPTCIAAVIVPVAVCAIR